MLAVLALVGIRQNQAESDRAARSTAFARLAAGLAPSSTSSRPSAACRSATSTAAAGGGGGGCQQRRAVDQAAAYRANAERLSADDELPRRSSTA